MTQQVADDVRTRPCKTCNLPVATPSAKGRLREYHDECSRTNVSNRRKARRRHARRKIQQSILEELIPDTYDPRRDGLNTTVRNAIKELMRPHIFRRERIERQLEMERTA